MVHQDLTHQKDLDIMMMVPSFSCGDSSAKGQKCKGTRGDFGEPHSSREDYDEYKFVLMDVGLIFKGQRQPDPDVVDKEPEVKEIKTESYDIQFYVPLRI